MNKFLFAPAAAAMLVFAGCSNEDLPAPAGDDGTVTFDIAMPATMASRYGEGQVVKQLHYAVYDVNNPTAGAIFASDVDGSPMAANSSIDFKLELKLVKGKTYDFIFWADAADNTFYTFSSADKTVKIDYTAPKGNDEDRDAFFQAVKGVDVKGAMTMPVELRRPFAQLNFGTDDIEEAATAKTVIKSTAVKVKGVYTKLDLYGGIASDPTTVTFTSEALPTDQTFPVDGDYDYLTMDYLLSGIELEGEGPDADVQSAKREMMEATLTFTFADGQTADVLVPNMPVQRNYRTNVFGSLITSPMNLDIVVKPGFEDEPGYEVNTDPKEPAKDADGTYLVKTQGELAWIADKVKGGDMFSSATFSLQNDIFLTGEWTPIGGGGLDFDKRFCGTFLGNGHTIHNMVVKAGERAGFFGFLNGRVEDLNFDNAKVSGNHWGGVVAGYSDNETGTTWIKNCKVTNSSVVLAAEDMGTSYDNGDKAGAIIGFMAARDQVENCVVKNCTIQGYRDLGGVIGYASGSVIKNNTVNGLTIVVDNSHNYKNYTTLAEHDANGVIGENAGATDEGNTAAGVTVAQLAATQADFTAALKGVKAGEINDFYLAEGEYTLSIPAAEGATVNIYGTSKDTKISTNTGACLFQNVNLYNLTVMGKGTYTGFQHLAGEATFTDCVIENYFCGYAPTLKFTDCVFNTSDYALWTYASTDAQFKDCTFNCGGSKSKAILVYVEAADYPGADITIDGCTFNGNGTVAEKGVVEIHTETWTANPTGTVKISNSSYNGTFIAWVNELNNRNQEPTHFWTSVITDSTPAE